MKGQMAGDLQDMEPESSDEETEVDLEPTATANSKVTPATKQQPAAAGAKKTNSKSRYMYNYLVMKSDATEGGCMVSLLLSVAGSAYSAICVVSSAQKH